MGESQGNTHHSGQGKVLFIPGVFNQTLNMLDEARDYFSQYGEEDQEGIEPHLRALYCSEMTRITLRLSSIMAWIIVQRAVASGKIEAAEAASRYGLDFQDICTVDNRVLHGVMPPYVCSLLDRSLELYERVQRLDDQIKEAVLH